MAAAGLAIAWAGLGLAFEFLHWSTVTPAVHWWSVPALCALIAAGVERFVRRDAPEQRAPLSWLVVVTSATAFAFCVAMLLLTRRLFPDAPVPESELIELICIAGLGFVVLAVPGPQSKA